MEIYFTRVPRKLKKRIKEFADKLKKWQEQNPDSFLICTKRPDRDPAILQIYSGGGESR